MKQVVVISVLGNFPECQEKTCPFVKECANHSTAGDFRTEDGLTPDLEKQGNVWTCSKNPQSHNGAILCDGGHASDYLYKDD